MRLNGLKVVYQFCMQEHIEDLRYITQVQADKLEKYADTAYAKELAERELRECQKYLFCHAKNILWDSTVWYLERLHPGSNFNSIYYVDVDNNKMYPHRMNPSVRAMFGEVLESKPGSIMR